IPASATPFAHSGTAKFRFASRQSIHVCATTTPTTKTTNSATSPRSLGSLPSSHALSTRPLWRAASQFRQGRVAPCSVQVVALDLLLFLLLVLFLVLLLVLLLPPNASASSG